MDEGGGDDHGSVTAVGASRKSTCFVVPSPAQSIIGDLPTSAAEEASRVQFQTTYSSNSRADAGNNDTAAGAERIAHILTKFKAFTPQTYANLKMRIFERSKFDAEKKERDMEDAKLIDGQLVVDDDTVERDPKLAEGKFLPKSVAKHFPKQLLGCPVEDIDPYYREYEETFMVVTRRFNKFGYIVRFSASPSMYIFPVWNPIRRVALYTYVHPLFDLIVIFTILANSLYMAMNIDESVPEYTFLALYTFEAIVKSIARGMVLRPHTYLRDPWNWLDFVVLISAYATIIAQSASGGASVNVQALRTFRVFRVLKTIAVIPGLKRIIEALLRALKMLGDVYLMTFFFFTIFALFGVEIFQGSLKTKCVRNADWMNVSLVPNSTGYIPWSKWITNSSNWNLRDDGLDLQICGNISGTQRCPANFTCLTVDSSPNPQYDFTNFDNFYSSFMVAIQIFNTDYWDYLYVSVISANGYGAFVWFIAGIVLLSYYLANLFQAVVALSYQVEEEEEDEDAMEGVVEKKEKPRLRFVFDPWKVRNLPKEGDARSRSLLSVREVTERKLGIRKGSISTKSNPGSVIDDDEASIKLDPGNEIATGKSKSKMPGESHRRRSSSKPVAVVKPQPVNEFGETDQLEEDVDDGEEKEPGSGSLSSHSKLTKDAMNLKWPGWSNAVRYRVRSRPPSAVSSTDAAKVGFWDRNPICCMVCCVGYFPWLKFQHYLTLFVTDPFFDIFIMATIVVNTVSMASYYYGIPDNINNFLNSVNDVCTYIFLAECFFKLMALCGEYFANRWNWLDFVVVIGSVVDIVTSNANISSAGFNTSIIRLLRLLRILKLAKSWKTMRTLLEIIFATVGAIANLMLVLLIVIFIFAVIGMQLFGDAYAEYKFLPGTGRPSFTVLPGFVGVPTWNWSDFFHSFMSVFRILCRETYQPMWDCITAAGAGICIPFYLAALMIGSYVVLNLFMAVLLNAFSSENLSKRQKNDENDRLRKRMKTIKAFLKRHLCVCLSKLNRRVNPLHTGETVVDDDATTVAPVGDDADVNSKKSATDQQSSSHVQHHVKLNVPKGDNSHDHPRHVNHVTETTPSETRSTSGTGTRGFNTARSTGGSVVGSADDVVLRDCCWPFFDRTFPRFTALFTSATRFGSLITRSRIFCLRLSEHKAFEYTILGFILASSISLCMQDANLVDGSTMDDALSYLDYIYLGVFAVEMMIKIYAHGVRRYFTSFWTLLDFFIVATAFADVVMGQLSSSSNLTALRALRTLRALRPLRAISRWQGMRIVVNALIAAIPPIANVLLVVMIIWLIFAIMGVQFFAGKFSYCVETATGARVSSALVPDRDTCNNNTNFAWSTYVINFDNIGNAYLALLQVATFEGWTAIIQMAVDAPDNIGQQPTTENNVNYNVYFVVFSVICSFFLLNLFVGVIIDGFNALKKQYEGSGALQLFMTDSQKQYYNTIKKLGSKKPKKTIGRPKNKFAGLMYDIASSSRFEAALAVAIAMNVVVLATNHYNQPYLYSFFQEMVDITFTTIFVFEAIVLLIALRHYYFRNLWHLFDFIVVSLSAASYGLADILAALSVSPNVLHALRLLRVGRVLRLIRSAKGVRKLMFSFVMSIPALFNICCLLFLIIFIYAIIGMNLFGHVGHFGGNLDDIANFHTFVNALMTLFRLTTVSGWDNVHQGLSFTDEPSSGCQPNISLSAWNYAQLNPCCNRTHWKRPNGEIVQDKSGWGNCGNYSLASIYCVSYLLCSSFIIVNMFAAVILDNYQQAVEQEETGVTDDDIEIFYRVWEHFDPSASQFIPLNELQTFAASLEPPLACPKPNEHALTVLDIPILRDSTSGQEVVHCLDVLIALIRKALGFIDETEEFVQVRETLESHFKVAFPNRVQTERVSSTKMRKKQDIAARTLQKAWRNYRMEKSWRKAARAKVSDSPSNDLSRSASPAPVSPSSNNPVSHQHHTLKASTSSVRG